MNNNMCQNVDGYAILKKSYKLIEDIHRDIVAACLHPENYTKDFIHEQRCKLKGIELVNRIILDELGEQNG